jgi:hypothetical protein
MARGGWHATVMGAPGGATAPATLGQELFFS